MQIIIYSTIFTILGVAALLALLLRPRPVRCWHKADMLNALTNVSFWGKTDIDQTAAYQTRFMSTRPSTMLPPSPTQYPMPVPTTATTTQALILPEDFSWGAAACVGYRLEARPVRAFSAGALRRLLDVDDGARPASLAVKRGELSGIAPVSDQQKRVPGKDRFARERLLTTA